jgi:hypothetical protein
MRTRASRTKVTGSGNLASPPPSKVSFVLRLIFLSLYHITFTTLCELPSRTFIDPTGMEGVFTWQQRS